MSHTSIYIVYVLIYKKIFMINNKLLTDKTSLVYSVALNDLWGISVSSVIIF